MMDEIEKNPILYDVAVNAPLMSSLTYSSQEAYCPGSSIKVPLGKRTIDGIILRESKKQPEFKIRSVASINEDRPALKEIYLQWLEWLSRYYLHPIGLVTELVFPPLSKRTKRTSRKRSVIPETQRIEPPRLTEEQQTVLSRISLKNQFATHLIVGVTGSGKTEIYLRMIENRIQQGKQTLFLIPEIALTPQLIQRFAARFGNEQICVLHSQLTPREKTEQWWRAVDGESKVIIGTRSALFCPLPHLGLIIIDEEHESSFKQEEQLKYHARDAAIMLAKMVDCPIVMGSATPSLESYRNALEGRFELHYLKKRVEDRPLPLVEFVNMRDERQTRKDSPTCSSLELPFWLSERLYESLKLTLAKGEQSALFLNRRGVAQSVQCPSCGHVPECPNCSVALTLHGQSHLLCHYCAYQHRFPPKCPDCHQGELNSLGIGTEGIEIDLRKLFPEARLARADRDQIQNREDIEDLIREMEDRKIDILIGTQMIAKGLDFPGLTLVGLVLADVGLHLPDFRAAERTFQLLTQVSGRSGRHQETPGQVIIQTYDPNHTSLVYAQQHDFAGFARQELEMRKHMKYPPYGKILSFRIQSMSLEGVKEVSHLISQRARKVSSLLPEAGLMLLGPAPAPMAKLRNQYRYNLLIKGLDSSSLNTLGREVIGDGKWIPAKCKVLVDVDPIHLL